jgi:ribonucleotide monophosphatase NagD (HAD superfamily)
VLRSSGRPGREHEASTQLIPVFTSSADFHYGSTHSLPRLTNGAFLLCLRTVFAQATAGRSVHVEIFGKPSQAVYTCARERLQQRRHKFPSRSSLPPHADQGASGGPSEAGTNASFSKEVIYMIGDNPHSDIQGALAAGHPWRAVLVRTGCFQGGENDPEFPAHHVCEDILAAVKFVLGEHDML